MKRLLSLLLALCLILSLAACGSKNEETTTEEPTVEEEAPLPEEEDVVIESEVVDPDVDVPAQPEEEEQPAVEMPKVDAEEEVKPEEAPVVTPEAPVAGSVDLNAFYLSLVESYGENFPATMNLCEMPEMQEDLYPGLSAIGTKQMMIYQPMMGAVVCEIALVEVVNSADIDAVKAMMQARIDTQVDGGAWYPESIEGWKNNSRIVVNGNCVMMIAYSDCDAIVDAFNGLF